MKTFLWLVAATAVTWVANLFGYWQVAVLVGALLALFYSTGRAVLLGLLTGALGWGLPLWTKAFAQPIAEMANLVGQMLMLPGGPVATGVLMVLPSLIGGLLTLSGAWIVGTLRTLVASFTSGAKQSSKLGQKA